MSKKSAKIASIIESFEGRGLDPHYLGYFECFNRQLFFEAHEVLEALWLPERGGPRGLFFKGLIQLAGAFVHFQKGRLQPAAALLTLAHGNLGRYPAHYEGLETSKVREMIEAWLTALRRQAPEQNPLLGGITPRLVLQADGANSPGVDHPPSAGANS